MAETYVLVGLGNPGRKYAQTRHNLGFMVVDFLARQLNCRYDSGDVRYDVAQSEIADKNLILAKPLTFMNRSGEAVLDLIERFEIPLNHLLVILDDLNLPFGKIRIRSKGSDGGHNGLASVIYSLRSEDFPRLRIGIDDGRFRDAVTFVLSNFSRQEQAQLPEIIERAGEACLSFVEKGVVTTMNKFN